MNKWELIKGMACNLLNMWSWNFNAFTTWSKYCFPKTSKIESSCSWCGLRLIFCFIFAPFDALVTRVLCPPQCHHMNSQQRPGHQQFSWNPAGGAGMRHGFWQITLRWDSAAPRLTTVWLFMFFKCAYQNHAGLMGVCRWSYVFATDLI